MLNHRTLSLLGLLAGFSANPFALSSHAQSLDTPITRLRPIGSPSLVDQYRSDAPSVLPANVTAGYAANSYGTTAQYETGVRQTAMLQQGGVSAPPLPGGGFALPPGTAPSLPMNPAPSLPNSGYPNSGYSVAPQPTAPPIGSSLPSPPANSGIPNQLAPVPRSPAIGGTGLSGDYMAVPQPQLGTRYATIDNCANITPPSSYSAASVGCGSPVYYNAPAYAPPPAQLVPPTTMPGAVGGRVAPLPSLFTLGQEYNTVQVGQGIIGQPVAYVPGQTIRNFLRYLSP